MKLVGGNDMASLQAQVTIRNGKVHKLSIGNRGHIGITMANIFARHKPSNNRIVLLKCLPDTKNNVICPIKLLIIHALRHGYVNGKPIDEVLSNMYVLYDRQIT